MPTLRHQAKITIGIVTANHENGMSSEHTWTEQFTIEIISRYANRRVKNLGEISVYN